MSIRVCYTGDIFRRQRFGGISRYFVELIKRLPKDDTFTVHVDAFLHINQHLGFGTYNQWTLPTYYNLQNTKLSNFVKALDNKVLKRKRGAYYDVIHETFFGSFTENLSGKSQIVTIYDLIREKFDPGSPQLSKRKVSIEKADHIICISNKTKEDFLEYYKVDETRISVIHLGVDNDSARKQEMYQPSSPNIFHLLYIGQRAGYKNFSFLLHAWSKSKLLRENFRLEIVGPRLEYEELKLVRNLDIQKSVFYLGESEKIRKAALLRADALLVTSLYEGFGLPSLEALASGLPVISSGTGAQREVLANAATYFDPLDIDSFINIISVSFSSTQYMQKMKSVGLDRAVKFSWDKVSRDTAALYARITNK